MSVPSNRVFNPLSDAASLAVGVRAGSGVSSREILAVTRKTILRIVDLSITMTDAGAAGSQGSQKLYDYQESGILILGAIYSLTTLAGSGGITDTAALVGSLGSAAAGAGDATLTGTEADIIASTAGTLAAGAGVLKKLSGAPAAPFDGTTTPVDVYLNLAVPDAGSTANDTVLVNGTVTVYWMPIGDF